GLPSRPTSLRSDYSGMLRIPCGASHLACGHPFGATSSGGQGAFSCRPVLRPGRHRQTSPNCPAVSRGPQEVCLSKAPCPPAFGGREAGLRPQPRLWPLVRFASGLAAKPRSAPPPACRWTGLAPHASLPAKLVASRLRNVWRASKRGTRAAPRHSASGRMTAPGALPPTLRLRATIGPPLRSNYRLLPELTLLKLVD